MAIVKVIEVMADSSKSWEDATRNGVREAAKSVKSIKSVWVKDQSVMVDGDSVTKYRVTLKISFSLER